MTPPRRRVLCACPDEDTCRTVSAALRREGHEVVTARTFSECLEAAREGAFDLYTLGGSYAEGDGLELCRRLRELTPATPVLFLPTPAPERDGRPAAASGAARRHVRPDDIFKVLDAVNSILAPRRAGD